MFCLQKSFILTLQFYIEEQDEIESEAEEWESVDDNSDEENDADSVSEEGEWEEVNEDEDEESDEEVDEDGVDIDVCDSDEGAIVENKAEKGLAGKKKVDVSKVISKDDLDFLKSMKGSFSSKKRSRSNPSESSAEEDEDDDEDDGKGYVVDPSSLAPTGRLHKATKIEKMKKILEGRNPVKFVHEGHAGGLTNKEKQRKKNYLMVRRGKRSVAQKARRSLSDVRAANNSKVSISITIDLVIRFSHICSTNAA